MIQDSFSLHLKSWKPPLCTWSQLLEQLECWWQQANPSVTHCSWIRLSACRTSL